MKVRFLRALLVFALIFGVTSVVYAMPDDGYRTGPGQPGGNPDCLDCPCDACVPLGDEYHYGPQPDQPGPGMPGGNPDCTDCVPIGDEYHYGPQPDQPGPGQPGGNPDCIDCLQYDCVPVGDSNQYGKK